MKSLATAGRGILDRFEQWDSGAEPHEARRHLARTGGANAE